MSEPEDHECQECKRKRLVAAAEAALTAVILCGVAWVIMTHRGAKS